WWLSVFGAAIVFILFLKLVAVSRSIPRALTSPIPLTQFIITPSPQPLPLLPPKQCHGAPPRTHVHSPTTTTATSTTPAPRHLRSVRPIRERGTGIIVAVTHRPDDHLRESVTAGGGTMPGTETGRRIGRGKELGDPGRDPLTEENDMPREEASHRMVATVTVTVSVIVIAKEAGREIMAAKKKKKNERILEPSPTLAPPSPSLITNSHPADGKGSSRRSRSGSRQRFDVPRRDREDNYRRHDGPSALESEVMEEDGAVPAEDEDPEAAMRRMMGFGGFETTKNKHVPGTDVSAVSIKKTRQYRQYMNRRGGFNRPLDKIA
ncbi:hypothetical protein BC938DRAFT_472106, partial [Jimgerdemannia flammicorona]